MAFDPASAVPYQPDSSAPSDAASKFDPTSAHPVVDNPQELDTAYRDQYENKRAALEDQGAKLQDVNRKLDIVAKYFSHPMATYEHSVEQSFDRPAVLGEIPRIDTPADAETVRQAVTPIANAATGTVNALQSAGGASLMLNPVALAYATPYFAAKTWDASKKAFSDFANAIQGNVDAEGKPVSTGQLSGDVVDTAMNVLGTIAGATHGVKGAIKDLGPRAPEPVKGAFDIASSTPVESIPDAPKFDPASARPVTEVAATDSKPSPEVQFTVFQPEPLPDTGKMVPGYVQIETKTNEGRGEPLTDAQRAEYPTPDEVLASGLPTGQYTLDQITSAIKDKAGSTGSEPTPPISTDAPPAALTAQDGGPTVQDVTQVQEPAPPAQDPAPASPDAPQAVPADAPKITATKNAQVDIEREARGLPKAMEAAAHDFPAAWGEATKALDQNPAAGEELVASLKDTPRALSDTENAILLQRQIGLQNEFEKVGKRINDETNPVNLEQDRILHAKLSDQLLDVYNVGKSSGTETGRGLNARKMLASENFSLSAMVTERRAAKGGRQLTPEETSQTQALHDKIAETQKAFDDYRAANKPEVTAKSRKAAESSLIKSLGTRADAARARIIARLKSGQTSAGIDPALLKDYAEVGAYHLARGIAKAADFAAEMKKEFGDKIEPYLDRIREEAQKIHDSLVAQDPRLKSFKTRTANRIEELNQKTESKDFSAKKKPEPIKLDEEGMRLQANLERAKQSYQEAVIMDRISNRTPTEKALDTIAKWRRGFILSSPVTLVKLTSAAIQRGVITPIEEGVGAALGKLPGVSEIAKRAPREGGINITAESKAITEGLTKGMHDSYDLLKTGKSNLEVLFGKGKDAGVRESDLVPRSVIDFFGQIHGALKSPVKRAEFTRSLEKRIAFSAKNGADVSDPMVQTRLMVEAYKDANRSIFLQDNVLVDGWNGMLRFLEAKQKDTGKPSTVGKIAATAGRVLVPIIRVPTNIVAETLQYAVGTVTGSVRMGRILRRGVETLNPNEADLVLRELKKGSLGAAALLIGYLNADKVGGYYQSGSTKKNPKDPTFGSMQVFGRNIPSYLLHSPLLETVQIGATIRKVAESKFKKHDKDAQGLASGVWAGALGLLEGVPFVRQQVENAKMLDSKEGPYARGEFAKSMVVPSGVEFIARQLDKNAKGDVIKRKPTTTIQHIETGIPVLRKEVPAKR